MIKVVNLNLTNFSQIPTGWINMTVEEFTRTYFLTFTKEGTYTTTLPGCKYADEFEVTDTDVCDFEFYSPDEEPDNHSTPEIDFTEYFNHPRFPGLHRR